MNEQQAIEAAKQIGVAPGDYITLQSEGQINNPHLHPGQTSGELHVGELHVDGWKVENSDGTLHATKIWSDR